ncbi:helix-turn-helix transcriptional regulator [Rariglobus hedericola]|uniref:Helix-turn-helix domain-containing protein n=1 Tax=Rariglobus hedericola TaxID=2597822 RepID=A0A556QKZ8_9BACT|nr:helix-turn-helix domain-containing protein [Rariglobus hedericola]TSJ77297.1 helix-turn-helix domain-containing protein [Rariglobus hedericola]
MTITPPTAAASLFQRTLDLLNATAPLRASFEDFTGVTIDYPQLLLPISYEIHTCAACMYAKTDSAGARDCSINKGAANRMAIHRAKGFGGLCHLGLFDLVEPLIVSGAVLGVFYYGSVVVIEREPESLRRLHRYCQRRAIDPSHHLAAWKAVSRIREADIAAHQERLRTVVESVRLWCEALAIPVERYPPLRKNVHWITHHNAPPLVRTAIKFVARRFGQSCRVIDIAAHAGCHPNYLSGEFKRHTGDNLTAYIEWVRIERAKAMLHARKLSVGEIAHHCGFADPSHFVRVFKRRTGKTPRVFQFAESVT